MTKTKKKRNLSAAAIRLLRRVAAHILEEPKRFQMENWISRPGDRWKVEDDGRFFGCEATWEFPKCQTVACVGGWTELLGNAKRGRKKASVLLGLREYPSRLFNLHMWPSAFLGKYREDGSLKSAKVAAARIEHFIKTDGAE